MTDAVQHNGDLVDIEVVHHGGLIYDCTAVYRDGTRKPIIIPRWADMPDGMDPHLWAMRHTMEEIFAAEKVYTDIWTWQVSSPVYHDMMKIFSRAAATKRRNKVWVGSIRFNTSTTFMEVFDGNRWVVLPNSGTPDITDEKEPHRTS